MEKASTVAAGLVYREDWRIADSNSGMFSFFKSRKEHLMRGDSGVEKLSATFS